MASVIDAMDEMALNGLIEGCGRAATSRRFHGPAATLRMGVAELDRPTREHWQFFDESASGCVLVIATDGAEFTVLGGVAAAVAAARGVAGIVTDGGVRDVDEIARTGVPVRFAHHNPRSCAGGFKVLETGKSIIIGGQRITPGDYLVSDSDGLVAIPALMTSAVLTRAAEIERHETKWASAAASLRSVASGYAAITTTAGTPGTKEN